MKMIKLEIKHEDIKELFEHIERVVEGDAFAYLVIAELLLSEGLSDLIRQAGPKQKNMIAEFAAESILRQAHALEHCLNSSDIPPSDWFKISLFETLKKPGIIQAVPEPKKPEPPKSGIFGPLFHRFSKKEESGRVKGPGL